MNWFTTWLFTRALKIPTRYNSGGKILRLYKNQIFDGFDAAQVALEGKIPTAHTLAEVILAWVKLPPIVEAALGLFLEGLLDNLIKKAGGSLDNLFDDLKNKVETVK